MNVLVDGRTFVKSSAGISTFLRCSLIEWALLCHKDNFYLFLPRELDNTVDFSGIPDNIKPIVMRNKLLKWMPNLLMLLLLIPYYIRSLKADIYYTPVPCIPFFMPNGVKTLVVVHDVVNLQFAETMELKNKIANILFFKRSIRQADYLWTNSYYTKSELEKYVKKRKCRDIFVGCSVDRNIFHKIEMTSDEIHKFRENLNIHNPYFLFVGSLEPRKNLQFLLKIMPEVYRKTGCSLVVVGARGWGKTNIKDIIESEGYPKECVKFMGYISNEDLVKLYSISVCFVSASLNEGFGMPQLEAMLCGCPVITSQNSAMKEVAGDNPGAQTIEGYNEEIWVKSLIESTKTRRAVSISALDRYNWKEIVLNLVKTRISI